MLRNVYPVFTKGRILKREMLEALRDFPHDVVNFSYTDYSNGIISGVEILVNKHEHTFMVTKGLVKFNSHVFVLSESVIIPYETTSKDTIVKIRFTEIQESVDFIEQTAEIILDENLELAENELELARYKLKEGAYLRSDYQSLADFTTEYNTLNIIHANYAALGEECTIHTNVLKYFTKELIRSGTQEIHDINFVMCCLNNRNVSRESIIYYIAIRNGQKYGQMSNEMIHRNFVDILRNVKNSGHRGPRRIGGGAKIIVD